MLLRINNSPDMIIVTGTCSKGYEIVKFGNSMASKIFKEPLLVYDQAHRMRKCQILDNRCFMRKVDRYSQSTLSMLDCTLQQQQVPPSTLDPKMLSLQQLLDSVPHVTLEQEQECLRKSRLDASIANLTVQRA